LLPIWLEERQHAVSAKTYKSDAALPRLVPTSLAVMQVRAVTDREVSRVLIALLRGGLAESSVKRFRDSLSAFFAWTVRERMIAVNPVTPTRVPKASAPRVEMYPFSEAELEAFYRRAAEFNQRLADLLLIDGWTGLRWSELRGSGSGTSSRFRCRCLWSTGPSRRASGSRPPSRTGHDGFRSLIVCCS
jgi:integrase